MSWWKAEKDWRGFIDSKLARSSVVIPLGLIECGSARQRVLLYKTLADSLNLRCRIVKGRPAGAAEGDSDARAIITVGGREMAVELVTTPGILVALDGGPVPAAGRSGSRAGSVASRGTPPGSAGASMQNLAGAAAAAAGGGPSPTSAPTALSNGAAGSGGTPTSAVQWGADPRTPTTPRSIPLLPPPPGTGPMQQSVQRPSSAGNLSVPASPGLNPSPSTHNRHRRTLSSESAFPQPGHRHRRTWSSESFGSQGSSFPGGAAAFPAGPLSPPPQPLHPDPSPALPLLSGGPNSQQHTPLSVGNGEWHAASPASASSLSAPGNRGIVPALALDRASLHSNSTAGEADLIYLSPSPADAAHQVAASGMSMEQAMQLAAAAAMGAPGVPPPADSAEASRRAVAQPVWYSFEEGLGGGGPLGPSPFGGAAEQRQVWQSSLPFSFGGSHVQAQGSAAASLQMSQQPAQVGVQAAGWPPFSRTACRHRPLPASPASPPFPFALPFLRNIFLLRKVHERLFTGAAMPSQRFGVLTRTCMPVLTCIHSAFCLLQMGHGLPFGSPMRSSYLASGGSSVLHGDNGAMRRSMPLTSHASADVGSIEFGPAALVSDDTGHQYIVQPVRTSLSLERRWTGVWVFGW